MIRSQIVTLRVFWEDDDEEMPPKNWPHEWDWDALVDEPIRPAVEVLAYGTPVDHPRPGEGRGA